MNWTEDQDEVVKEHWGKTSAAEIGDMIGRNKNMVIGRAKRLGLKLLKKPPRRRCEPKPEPKARIKMERIVQEVLFAPPSLAVSILDLGPLQCSYIEGNDRLCCGQPSVPGARWCAFHYRVVYRPIDHEQRARSKLAAE